MFRNRLHRLFYLLRQMIFIFEFLHRNLYAKQWKSQFRLFRLLRIIYLSSLQHHEVRYFRRKSFRNLHHRSVHVFFINTNIYIKADEKHINRIFFHFFIHVVFVRSNSCFKTLKITHSEILFHNKWLVSHVRKKVEIKWFTIASKAFFFFTESWLFTSITNYFIFYVFDQLKRTN